MAISQFYTGFIKPANFFQEEGEEAFVKKALVAVEGSFRDSNGVPHTFAPDRLETIADYTNKALDSGIPVPVCTDHNKTVENTVGNVEGRAYTKVIEEADLPNAKAAHLVGKLGLFLDNVAIKSQNAIEKVKNGIVTSVSMGLNLDKNDHRIMELSLVPIPAIPNMGLFSFGVENDNNIFTWEDYEYNERSLDELKEEYDNLQEKLWTILNNIYTSDVIDIEDVATLQQYVYNALNGFSIRIVDLLGLNQATQAPIEQAGVETADQQLAASQTQYNDVASASPGNARYSRSPRYTANFSYRTKYRRGR